MTGINQRETVSDSSFVKVYCLIVLYSGNIKATSLILLKGGSTLRRREVAAAELIPLVRAGYLLSLS